MLTSMILSGAAWVAATAESIIGLWFLPANEPAVPLAAVLGLAAVVGVTWQQSRARATRRWLAVLDAYAEREITRQRRRNAQERMRALSSALRISSSTDE
jgi:hypothetical protein